MTVWIGHLFEKVPYSHNPDKEPVKKNGEVIMEELILAYDFGTSGVKAILIDREGHVLSTSEEAYPLFNPEPLYVEQSTDDYWNAVCHVTRKVMKNAGRSPEQVKGMSFSVQAYNTIPVDKEGNVLHNAISWLDGRAQEEADAINHACGAELVRSQDFQCRMMWVKNKLPEIYEKTYAFLDCSGFLSYQQHKSGIAHLWRLHQQLLQDAELDDRPVFRQRT